MVWGKGDVNAKDEVQSGKKVHTGSTGENSRSGGRGRGRGRGGGGGSVVDDRDDAPGTAPIEPAGAPRWAPSFVIRQAWRVAAAPMASYHRGCSGDAAGAPGGRVRELSSGPPYR